MVVSASAFFLFIGTLPEEPELGAVSNEALTLPLLWLAILAFWVAGSWLTAGPVRDSGRRVLPVLIGLTGLAAFFLCAIPSEEGWPIATAFLVLTLVIAAYALALRHFGLTAPGPLSWFALGWYLNIALLSWTAMLTASPVTVLADAILLGGLFLALFRVSKRKTA